jgi:hypothetical protein
LTYRFAEPSGRILGETAMNIVIRLLSFILLCLRTGPGRDATNLNPDKREWQAMLWQTCRTTGTFYFAGPELSIFAPTRRVRRVKMRPVL